MIKNVEHFEYELDPTTWGFQIQKRVNAAKQDNQPNLAFERFVRFFQSLDPEVTIFKMLHVFVMENTNPEAFLIWASRFRELSFPLNLYEARIDPRTLKGDFPD